MITEWSLALWISINGSWGQPTIKPQLNESSCIQSARNEWKAYWSKGNEDDSKLRVKCYNQDDRTQYWVRCTKYDSCSVKG